MARSPLCTVSAGAYSSLVSYRRRNLSLKDAVHGTRSTATESGLFPGGVDGGFVAEVGESAQLLFRDRKHGNGLFRATVRPCSVRSTGRMLQRHWGLEILGIYTEPLQLSFWGREREDERSTLQLCRMPISLQILDQLLNQFCMRYCCSLYWPFPSSRSPL
jgi:hypothetical protein